ncbi:hypothetical protein [Candidatus Entotheonella palauensis]|uniref:hypothetical protein n=1 Tax=Candidatus Entotheonella palauensis TaxID=93172 RepID=UPI000B80249B|nr:hypothetical protein [Candidatus Entotheonella palauensis]
MSTHHGVSDLRGFDARKEVAQVDSARFQRMFPQLPPLYTDPRLLTALGQPGGPMDEGSLAQTGNMPAGFVFLGWT